MVFRRVRRQAVPVAVAPMVGTLWVGGPAGAAGATSSGELAQAFAAASQHYKVPEELLLAVSYLETGWNATYHGTETGVDTYGPMALYQTPQGHGTLEQAASDLGTTTAPLETNPSLNIAGAAAVLAADAKAIDGYQPVNLNQWYGAAADYVGVPFYEPARQFADAVYQVLADGAEGTASNGEQLSIPSATVNPDTSEIDILNLTHLQPQQSDYPGTLPCSMM